MISIREALDAMMPSFTPRGVTQAFLEEAAGLHLATTLRSREDYPAFDNSAMDGYAVRSLELEAASEESPVTLPLAGESRAGGPPPPALEPGTAVRIFTGAPMPAGADAVVIQENTSSAGASVSFRTAPATNDHIRARGSDVSAGSILLPAGAHLSAGAVGLLASQGFATVPVHRRPVVALLSSGDELREIGEPDRPGSLVNSNRHALAVAIRDAGGVPLPLPTVTDAMEPMVAALREALASADLVVTTGSVSVGEYDLMRDAIERAGAPLAFSKVAIKPGKPVAFGVKGSVAVVGLPGNPVSAMVTFEVFVRPGIRRMLGDPRPHRELLPARLETPYRHRKGRLELARGKAALGDGGKLGVTLSAAQGSGALTSMVGVNALVVLPPEIESFEAGDPVDILPLGSGICREGSPFPRRHGS